MTDLCLSCGDKKFPGLSGKDLTESEACIVWDCEECPNCGSKLMEKRGDSYVCLDCYWTYRNLTKAQAEANEPDAIGPTQTMDKLKDEFGVRDIEQRSEMEMASDAQRSIVAEYNMMKKRDGEAAAMEWYQKEIDLMWKHKKLHGSMP